uniref:Putative secreted protein n=1 Tax=Ixodes ricinus TaxID=34613 RepID=A0A6B0U8R5_IXORI
MCHHTMTYRLFWGMMQKKAELLLILLLLLLLLLSPKIGCSILTLSLTQSVLYKKPLRLVTINNLGNDKSLHCPHLWIVHIERNFNF